MQLDKEGKKARNPFIFLVMRGLFKWEIAYRYGRANSENASRYFLYGDSDFSEDGKPVYRSESELAGIESDASYFIRDIYERVEDLEFSEHMLNTLTLACKKVFLSSLLWEGIERELKSHADAIWSANIVSEYGRYSKVPKELKAEIKLRVNRFIATEVANIVNLDRQEGDFDDFGDGKGEPIKINAFQVLRIAVEKDLYYIGRFLASIQSERDFEYFKEVIEYHPNTTWVFADIYGHISAILIVAVIEETLLSQLLNGQRISASDNVLDMFVDDFSTGKYRVKQTSKHTGHLYISCFRFGDSRSKKIVIEYMNRIFKRRIADFSSTRVQILWNVDGQRIALKKLGFSHVAGSLDNGVYITDSSTFSKMHNKLFEINL